MRNQLVHKKSQNRRYCWSPDFRIIKTCCIEFLSNHSVYSIIPFSRLFCSSKRKATLEGFYLFLFHFLFIKSFKASSKLNNESCSLSLSQAHRWVQWAFLPSWNWLESTGLLTSVSLRIPTAKSYQVVLYHLTSGNNHILTAFSQISHELCKSMCPGWTTMLAINDCK